MERLIGVVFKPVGASGFSERLVRAVERACDSHLQEAVQHTYAPNIYRLHIASQGALKTELVREIERELGIHIAGRAKDREYSLLGPVIVQITVDEEAAGRAQPQDIAVEAAFESQGAPEVEGTRLYSAQLHEEDNEATTRVFRRAPAGEIPLPAPAPVLAGFHVAEGPDSGADFEFGETRGTIGRLGQCLIELRDPKVSRVHAEIDISGKYAEIRDCGSTNGTRVNGRKVSSRRLRDGDRIRLGTTELVYRDLRPAKGR